ncbi:unnamed protein product [Cunninghamella blakesleeana]
MNYPESKRRRIQNNSTNNETQPSKNTKNTSYFSFYTPLILSSYAGMIFYSIIIISIDKDRNRFRIQQRIEDMDINIRSCYNKYQENQCSQQVYSPILKAYCDDCNPKLIKRANIAANVFGEIVNDFCQTLSTKTMMASCILVFAAILFSFSF